MLRTADVFGKLFVYGDPTIVESVIEIEIQRLLDFMSRETAKSTEAERFGGLVGLNAFAGSVADMFLGYVDNVLRGLTVPLCDTRVGAPPSIIFLGVVVDGPLPRSPAYASKPVSSSALASTSSARTRMSHLLHQWGTSSALRSKASVRPALPIAPSSRPLAWPSPWAAVLATVVAMAAGAYLRSSLVPYRSSRTSIAPTLCGCRQRTTKFAR